MNEPLLVARERTLLRDLAQRAAARARDEKLLGQTAPHAKAQAETAFESGRLEAEAKRKSEQAAVERETEEERAAIQALYDEEQAAAEPEFDEAREEMTSRCEEEKEAARNGLQERPAGRSTPFWSAIRPRRRSGAGETEKRLTAILDRLAALRRDAAALWDEWEEDYLHPGRKNAAGPRDKNPRLSLRKSLAALEERLADLRKRLQELALPKILKGGRLTAGLRRVRRTGDLPARSAPVALHRLRQSAADAGRRPGRVLRGDRWPSA